MEPDDPTAPARGKAPASLRKRPPSELLQVVLDDATVERLRRAASARQIEVEQLIVHVIHHASWTPDAFLDAY